MLYTLENEVLCVQVRSLGAELRSIRERADETEYLWNGDPVWWNTVRRCCFRSLASFAGENIA